MDSQNPSVDVCRLKIVRIHLELTALIQDTQQCIGPLELLNELNAKGREKIAALKSNIDFLATFIDEELDDKKKSELASEIDGYRSQLTAVMTAFRTANIVSACVIDKTARDELFSTSEEEQNNLRKRRDKLHLTNSSSQITNKLSSISRHLAETMDRSAITLDTLVTSSDKVSSTKKELDHQQQVILQSGKLLGKYGRREITDKALLALAFLFFLACVFYILQKRLF